MKTSHLAIAALCLFGCITIDKAYAESQGRAYASDLGIADAKVNCVNVDSNGDGYVSCTIASPGPDGKPHLQAIECAASQNGCNLNQGCRIPKDRLAAGGQ